MLCHVSVQTVSVRQLCDLCVFKSAMSLYNEADYKLQTVEEIVMLKKKRKKLILMAAVTVLTVWTVWGNVTVGTTHYTVECGRLPESFDHYRIAVISDVHNAQFGSDNHRLIDQVKKEKPDMIAITGDLVDSGRTDIETAGELVHQLTDIAPCYYVTGNHEAWIGDRYKELEKILTDESVVILHDRKIEIRKNNEMIQIAGLDDPDFTERDTSVQTAMLETKLGNMKLKNNFCLLLSHRPEAFDAYVAAEADLVLSGHAHGGQFRLPFIGGIAAPNQGFFPEYDAGIYSEENTTMIVSRGIGNSIIPVRFNNRPEVVSVELVCGR